MSDINTIVFDLGGVLIDWNPRYLYRKIFSDEAEIDRFLTDICSPEWNAKQDAGRPLREAIAERVERFPEWAGPIAAYYERWREMIRGPIGETVEMLPRLRNQGNRLLALTNWSHETFPVIRKEYGFFDYFEDILVSGTVRLAKPDPAIFQLMLVRFGVVPQGALFIDDNAENVKAASQLGIHGIHFTNAETLEKELRALGVL